MRIIAIANQKGGCGKTTTAINLAAALSKNGRRVLLIDLDPQAHASLGLNIDSQDSMYNVISSLTPRKLRIENIIRRVEESFDMVPSNVLVGTLEQELADEIGRELKLTGIIATIASRYDYILIDCAPSLGILTVNALRASSEVIIPVETSRFSIQGLEHIIDIIHLVRDRLNHPIEYRVLIAMFDSRLRHSFAMLQMFKDRFSQLLFDTIIHTNVKLRESVVLGQTVAAYDKYSRGSKDYFTLAKEVLCAEAKEGPMVTAVPKEARWGRAAGLTFSETMRETIEQEAKDVQKLASVRFSCKAQDAKSVFVTGSFNDWALDDNCRLKQLNGCWEVVLPLKPGIYQYQFIIDGVWKEDPLNPRKERNSFGDINSLIEVGTDG